MQAKKSLGFTLIEILIISPIVILFIGGFIGLIVSLTGESLQLQASNVAAFTVQDALDDMEGSATQATNFLTTTGTVQSPQGKNNATSAFTNTNGADPDSLIMNSAATTKGPYDSTRAIIYTGAGACDPQNPVYTYKTVYFVNTADSTLYKRTIMEPIAACAAAYQRGSCTESIMNAGNAAICKVSDEKLLTNVTGMDVQYFADGSSAVALSDTDAALATSISITLSFSKQVAGEPITYSGSARVSSLNVQVGATPQAPPALPNITWSRDETTYDTTFSWDAIGSATGYNIRYRLGSASWVNGPQNTTQTSYTIPNAARKQNVDIEVTVLSGSGNYLYDTVTTAVPAWNTCSYMNGWAGYGGGWPNAAYTRTSASVVVLRGLVAGGAANSVICTLPPGFRPDSQLIFQAQTSGTTAARVDVRTNGEVVNVTGSTTWVELSGINFMADGAGVSTKNLTGSGSWVYYGAPYSNVKLIKDNLGRSHLQGLGKTGTITAGTNAFGDFTGGYDFSYGLFIFPAMHHGNAPATTQISGNYVTTRGNMAGNSFWSQQALLYPTGSATWQTPTLAASWVNFAGGHATAGYTKSADDIVSLKGLIKDGTITGGTVMFTLPAGYRPDYRVMCSVITNVNAPARIDVNETTGTVMVREGVTAAYLSLAGCDFISD